MPNWCDNQITITGPNSVIDKIEKILKEESNDAEKGLLQFFHPMPKQLLDTEAGPIAKTKAEKERRQIRKNDCRKSEQSTNNINVEGCKVAHDTEQAIGRYIQAERKSKTKSYS